MHRPSALEEQDAGRIVPRVDSAQKLQVERAICKRADRGCLDLDSDRAKFLSQPRVDCRWAETVKTAPSDRAILERYGRVERACSRPPLPGAPGIGPPIDIRFRQVDRILIAIVCRQRGVRFSIDDFGTGYSSLAQFKHLPVDEIKIDKSFVLELSPGSEDAAIVRATVDLGHNFGVKVVAEGVENAPAWHTLLELGCDLAQGYLISPPVSVHEVIPVVTTLNERLLSADTATQQVRVLRMGTAK